MNSFVRTVSLALIPVSLLAACSSAPRSSRVDAPVYSGAPAYSDYGYVRSIEAVQTSGRTTGGGAIIGGVLGAVVGHQFGGGTGRDLSTAAGAVGGAIAGNEIERNRSAGGAMVYRVTIRMDNGDMRSIDVGSTNGLSIGERVRVEGDRIVRL
ncbi:MAG TPA: glycine zipper 2TM domain-containing protein [Burkholderiaceae bacterium]|jgi:outer membrane lipoprotein SlyB|nr:glycine zipper 2TM domain-containing protein [Burkholderiaceae bacterium]